MERKKIHPEGPEFSRIITGAWRWKSLQPERVEELINTSLEAGITTFDHADIYGDYLCEEIFGNALGKRTSLRSSLQLVSKCGIKLISSKKPEHRINHYDASKEHIIKSAEASLKNLRTDYLDLLLIHRPDPLMNPEEVAEAFHSLKQSGKVLYFGVSNFTPTQFELLQNFVQVPLVTNQIEVSLFYTDLLYDGTVDTLMKHRASPMAWSPLGGGKFFTEPGSYEAARVQLGLLSEKYECSFTQLLLAWILCHPSSMFPILGTSNPQRIKEGTETLNVKLEKQDWFILLKSIVGKDVP